VPTATWSTISTGVSSPNSKATLGSAWLSLGRRIGLSSPAVAERMQRLEEAGAVRGYRADIDPRQVGYALTAIIRMRPAPGQLRSVAELAQQTPEIVECHRITGDDCYIATVHLRDVGHLETVIDRFALLGQTTTSIVQSSPVRGRGLALRAAAADG